MHDELRAAVITYTSNPAYRPLKPRVIAEKLGLGEEAAAQLRKTIKKMVRAGELDYGPNHLVLPIDEEHPSREGIEAVESHDPPPPPGDGRTIIGGDEPPQRRRKAKQESGDAPAGAADETDKADKAEPKTDKIERPAARSQPVKRGKHVVGVFRRVSSGDGFLRPEGTAASAGKDDDIYVNQRNAGDAASGDKVRISIGGSGYRGKPEGKIVDVVERATNQFVGKYFEQDGQGLVEIDGKVFGAPIYVGDPGAKGAKDDDKVVVEMVRFPSHSHEGEGVISKILGEHGEPGVDTMSIKYEFGLPGDFPEDVLDDSRHQATLFAKVDEHNTIEEGRHDLTAETVVTIDPVTARDFDDAISLERIERGHWLLGVHIADVSHFVQPKSALDSEAYDRATSVYLPDEVIPMLPEIISNNLASLQPDKVRYAMTAKIEFTPDGAPVACDVVKSAIKSCRRFAYEEVDEYLAEKGLNGEKKPGEVVQTLTPAVDELLGRMFELAMILRRRRFERGALELNMPEIVIDLDDDGRVTGAHRAENTESHQIIEEFMLAANEAVARRLSDAGMIFLRRTHGNPDERKMKALTEFVRGLGLPADNLQDRFELQELLDRVKDDPRGPAVNFAVLRSMQKAVYSPEEVGHFALASEEYCHFTSPIRRYPDLTVHRLLDELNRFESGEGKKPVQDLATVFTQGDHCSDREHRAAQAERELKKVKLLNYLADKIGMEMEGVITGVERFGLFIAGKELPAEGFVHITALGDDYFEYDRASHSITGRRAGSTFRLGDTVRVAVAKVDPDDRELDFRLLGKIGKSPRGGSGGKKKGGKPHRGKGKGSKPSGAKPSGAKGSGAKGPGPKKSGAKKGTNPPPPKKKKGRKKR
ncbi:Ribonuclease R [Pseudobythopirellula maris]|uniref:Ribonuclease R n=1 Tax=Pseudobythopirellula maris TaxID=2527991 RepID=A0A5C5ZG22_9BACT|nr:ribonuclease R [Pseudobythopirellula maris]TWT86282.1 Ribonuclease R [Pseudobythopirellula maris]